MVFDAVQVEQCSAVSARVVIASAGLMLNPADGRVATYGHLASFLS